MLFDGRSTSGKLKRAALSASAIIAVLVGTGIREAAADTYAVELVTAQGSGWLLNNAGTLVGVKRTVGACPAPYPSCYSIDTVVAWPPRTNRAVPLPAPVGFPDISVSGINRAGWIAGTASFGGIDFRPQPVVWQPNSTGYTVQDIGLLAGNNLAKVAGIDDSNRVVGYATSTFFPPMNAAPFMWSPAGGLINLTSLGFPNDIPLAVSARGAVALNYNWYKLDLPGVVNANAPLPSSFVTAEAFARINDFGDQARFLLTSGSQNLAYLFRYIAKSGKWQQLHPAGTGRLARHGVGSIDNQRNLTATVQSSGFIAPGPLELAQSLTDNLSPAHAGISVTSAGPRNSGGMIAANVAIGRSSGRVARLIPVQPCVSSCVRVAAMTLSARHVTNCQTGNQVTANLAIRDESNAALSGVTVTGRFLDEYYLEKKVTGVTAADGSVRFVHKGPGCVGAVSFFVDNAQISGRSFDRYNGKLSDYVIPAP